MSLFDFADAGLTGLQCPQLAFLNLNLCCGLTDASLATLKCPLLRDLNLSQNSDLTDTGLAALRCPQLTSLKLVDCSGITVPENIKDAQEILRYAREATA